MGDLGSALGPDDTLVKVSSPMDCLDGGRLGGKSNLSCLNPLFSCPVVPAPVGHLSVSWMGFGEDKRVSVVYSPGKVLGDRDFPCLVSRHENCLENDIQVSTCLERSGQALPALLDGSLPSSLSMGFPSDTLGLMHSEKGACDHISSFHIDKPISLPVSLQDAGMFQEVCKGMNAELGSSPVSDANHEIIKSMDFDN